MRDEKLTALVVLAVVLNLGHTTDHVVRGDLRWPLSLESAPFILISLAIYTVVAGGLYLYAKGRIGPGFWAILASVGVAFGWLAHFSRFTDQPPAYFLGAYRSVAAGWLALLGLVTLMLVLIVTAVYAGYLWARRPQAR